MRRHSNRGDRPATDAGRVRGRSEVGSPLFTEVDAMHHRGVSRRGVLKGGAACAALAASRLLAGPVLAGPARPAGAATRRPAARPRVAVVGAGVFGGFTALSLV